MSRRGLSLVVIGMGIAVFVVAVYADVGTRMAELLLLLGPLAVLIGVVLLLMTSRPWHLSAPHAAVVGMAMVGAALHASQLFPSEISGGAALGMFLWLMVPYGLSLLLSAFAALRTPAIAGAALALASDLLTHFSLLVDPQGSTASVVLMFVPLWNTVLLVPVATLVAWLAARKRHKGGAP